MKNTIPFILILLVGLSCSSKPIATIALTVIEDNRKFSLVTLKEDLGLQKEQNYHLVDISSGKMIPLEVRDNMELIFLVRDLEKGTHYFEVREGKYQSSAKAKIEKQDEGYQFYVNDKPVLFYQEKTTLPQDVSEEYYQRSGFIHPLYSPSGQVLTDDFPEGHTHQHAIFNAWVNTRFKGEKVDFWNQHQETGTVAHVDILGVHEGDASATLSTLLSQISLEHGEVLSENWEITLYPFEEFFLFDLFFEQENTSEDTLYILDYHYGGMAFRGSKEWNDADTEHFSNTWSINTSEGHDNESANHTPAKWVTAYGNIDGEEAGLTVFSFPDNFRHPQKIRVHPTMPYWVYAPMVDGEFVIAPGEKYRGRYRYYVHQGAGNEEVIQSILDDLEKPLEVSVQH
ncbi:DUF6807 domain-containing protein [Pleomorphovibrio marinus]|uniref:DUF6807 domain-containing protein n=1 Tax=Pleomorphovibrio marinus TaxID=2164132 RepID=UPI000E0A80C6|nr:PmoA family protein [Pleomorphovibrio marinus]